MVGAAVWLFLRDFLQSALGLGATWKLVLGLVFVVLVMFLRRGLIGGFGGLGAALGTRATRFRPRPRRSPRRRRIASVGPSRRRDETPFAGPVIEARGVTKTFGGIVANRDINFAVEQGELRGIIGPNGAGKSTFFKMLTCEMRPTSGQIDVSRPRHHRHGCRRMFASSA